MENSSLPLSHINGRPVYQDNKNGLYIVSGIGNMVYLPLENPSELETFIRDWLLA
jgi:glucan biosynthesis protein